MKSQGRERKMNVSTSTNLGATLLAWHAVITRGLAVSIESCAAEQSQSSDDARRGGLADYVQTLTLVIDLHHIGEDDFVFPALEPLVSDLPYERLRADHQTIETLLRGLRDSCLRWREGDSLSLGEMLENLRAIDAIWHPHIAIEEAAYQPQLLAQLMSPEEHSRIVGQLVARGMQTVREPELFMPFVIFNASPEFRHTIEAALPPELLQEAIPNLWRDKWAPMKPFLLE